MAEHELRTHVRPVGPGSVGAGSVAMAEIRTAMDDDTAAIELREGAFCRPFAMSSDTSSSVAGESTAGGSSASGFVSHSSEREVSLLEGGERRRRQVPQPGGMFFRALRSFHEPPALVPSLPRPEAQRVPVPEM